MAVPCICIYIYTDNKEHKQHICIERYKQHICIEYREVYTAYMYREIVLSVITHSS